MNKINYLKTLPKKRMASGILIFDKNGKLLIVKPNYQDHWLIPGGTIEENESPMQACKREIKEEIGVNIGKIDFLCVDYKKGVKENDESLQFIFYGGILSEKKIAKIKIPKDEISDYKFTEIKYGLALLSKTLANRISRSLEALKNKTVIYLENSDY